MLLVRSAKTLHLSDVPAFNYQQLWIFVLVVLVLFSFIINDFVGVYVCIISQIWFHLPSPNQSKGTKYFAHKQHNKGKYFPLVIGPIERL